MTINCKGNLIDLTSPKVMGILNLTPDSFYDGGKYAQEAYILGQIEKMLLEGASFIDIGAYSSRPGAQDINEDEELARITRVLETAVKKFPETLFSIDTFRSKVAKECLDRGAALINDISGGNLDEKMMEVIAKHQVPYILMHMRGTPQSMKGMSTYDHVVVDVLKSLSENVNKARSNKINDLIIDPGFGFAKNINQNYTLLHHLERFKTFGLPLLVGLSRKSMIYKTLNTEPEEALNGTTVLHTVALLKGANILRVHDVKEAMECIQLVAQLAAHKT